MFLEFTGHFPLHICRGGYNSDHSRYIFGNFVNVPCILLLNDPCTLLPSGYKDVCSRIEVSMSIKSVLVLLVFLVT